MLDKAIEKIKKEMDQNKGNSYIQVVGEFLLQQLDANPGIAENISADDKTIAKSLDAMRKVAAGEKTGNYAVLTPQEGFEIVLKYFDITAEVKESPVIKENNQPKKKETAFDVRLEDLL